MDDLDTEKRFKAKLRAPFLFVPDPKGELVAKYDAKMLALPLANRVTFVIGEDGKVIAIRRGSDAIDPTTAVDQCPLHRTK